MKRVIVGVLSLALGYAAGKAIADEKVISDEKVTPHQVCKSYKSFAKTVMVSRQNGTSFSTVFRSISDFNEPALDALVDWAYTFDIKSAQWERDMEVVEFGNMVYKSCREGLQKNAGKRI